MAAGHKGNGSNGDRAKRKKANYRANLQRRLDTRNAGKRMKDDSGAPKADNQFTGKARLRRLLDAK